MHLTKRQHIDVIYNTHTVDAVAAASGAQGGGCAGV